MRNVGLKAFAVLLAALLYWFVNSEGNTSVITRLVSVELQGIPADRVVLSPLQTPQVQVSIRGPNSLVARLTDDPLAFRIPLPASAQNRFVASLELESLGLPPYLSVVRIAPSEVEYVLDRLVTREVPVSVPRIGMLRDSLEIVSLSIQPERVSVSGPASELDTLVEIDTLPLDLREVVESSEREMALRAVGTLLQLRPRKVKVTLELRVIEAERSFEKLAVEIRSPSGKSYLANPRAVNVRVKGARDLVAALDPKQVQPYVRIAEDDPALVSTSTSELPSLRVGIDLPAGVTALIEPEVVSIKLLASAVAPKSAPTQKNKRGK